MSASILDSRDVTLQPATQACLHGNAGGGKQLDAPASSQKQGFSPCLSGTADTLPWAGSANLGELLSRPHMSLKAPSVEAGAGASAPGISGTQNLSPSMSTQRRKGHTVPGKAQWQQRQPSQPEITGTRRRKAAFPKQLRNSKNRPSQLSAGPAPFFGKQPHPIFMVSPVLTWREHLSFPGPQLCEPCASTLSYAAPVRSPQCPCGAMLSKRKGASTSTCMPSDRAAPERPTVCA